MSAVRAVRARQGRFSGSPAAFRRAWLTRLVSRLVLAAVAGAFLGRLGLVVFVADPVFLLGWFLGLALVLPRIVRWLFEIAREEAAPWL